MKQMDYFVKVVDLNSFTLAAEELYISQSAVSQQIRALEDELGVTLLERKHRSFKVTPAGQYFYNQAKNILAQSERMRQMTISLGTYRDEHLSFGYLKGCYVQPIIAVMNEFNTLYPEVDLDITDGNHESLYEGLNGGGIDIVFNDQRRAFNDAYENRIVYTPRLYAAFSPRSELAGRTSVTKDDLYGQTCIVIASPEQEKQEYDYFRNTFRIGESIIFVSDIAEAFITAAAGKGYIIVEENRLMLEHHGLVYVPILEAGEAIRRVYCIFYKKDRENYYIEELADMLERRFE